MAKKSALTLSPRLIPVSSKEAAMLTEALGLIDYYHPQMRKQAMAFARSANLTQAIEILSRLERKRKEDYELANAPRLFDMGEPLEAKKSSNKSRAVGTAFDLGGSRDSARHLQKSR